jgi:hypothetical protein
MSYRNLGSLAMPDASTHDPTVMAVTIEILEVCAVGAPIPFHARQALQVPNL